MFELLMHFRNTSLKLDLLRAILDSRHNKSLHLIYFGLFTEQTWATGEVLPSLFSQWTFRGSLEKNHVLWELVSCGIGAIYWGELFSSLKLQLLFP